MIRLGLVVQRYGNDVLGGAETLAKNVAERLNGSGYDVTVFTTTAKDYITWRNEYEPGESILKGVVIKRYPVQEEREIESFNRYSERFFASDAGDRDENDWIRKQGPYAPDLIEGLVEHQSDIDLFIFFTYLYYPTIEGLKSVTKPAVLFPTAHDELPIYMNLMKPVFQRPDSIFFLTGAEMAFIKKTFAPEKGLSLIRTGVSIDDHVDVGSFKKPFLQFKPYMLYAGRIEKGKGLETVFDAYEKIRKKKLIDLVLIGKQLMDIPETEGIKYLGFVSEAEKIAAFKGAVVSIQPSPYESLSFTTLESFSQKTPVLVNAACPVLMEHVELSGGGFAYRNADEFARCLYEIYGRPKQRRIMGAKGYEYLVENFSWPVVTRRIDQAIKAVLS